MRRLTIFVLLALVFGYITVFASDRQDEPPEILDTYRISMGPQSLAIPGDPAFLIPLNIQVTNPTVRIELMLSYDPNILTPHMLAPNIFVQSFVYDVSDPGFIRIILVTDLPPPPFVPPIIGETTFAWISCFVTSRFIGYEYLTHINYFEDPLTPRPDNFIALENEDMVAPPVLELIPGDVLVWLPLYGDINDNSYAWEIGDAVTFLNFFMGMTSFTRRQYANSDCNLDGVQASISDLVFLLRVISDDTLLAVPPPPFANPDRLFISEETPAAFSPVKSTAGSCDFIIDDKVPIGGASFSIELPENGPMPHAVALDPSASGMRLYCACKDNILKVSVIDWDGQAGDFTGGRLFSLLYQEQPPAPKIISAEFSDKAGQSVSPAYRVEGAQGGESDDESDFSGLSMTLKGYPNPFNGRLLVSYNLPSAGRYELAIYDLLGRKVKTLLQGSMPSGPGTVAWEADDETGTRVASGTYFLRLRGEQEQNISRLFLLK